MSSQAVPPEVEHYFLDLQPEQRAVLYPVTDAIRDAMPEGYRLGMYFGMPGWVIPLETCPNTYKPPAQPVARPSA